MTGFRIALLLVPACAAAQPVSFQLKNDVPLGKKPALVVTATERVVDLRLDLVKTGGGPPVAERAASLSPGQSVTFSVGDGAPGKAHYEGALKMVVSGQGPWSYDLSFDTVVRGSELKVTYRRDHLDLEKHTLEFQVSRPVAKADVTVIGDDGAELGRGEAVYASGSPGAWLAIGWKQKPGNVMMLDLRVVDASGFGTAVHLTPWSVAIPHEEVTFETGSAVIPPSEQPKLDAAYRRIASAVAVAARFVHCLLFVSGHTDTVGSRDANHRLSVDRARAIAAYFRKQGLKIPISYQGFGEDVPRVKTPDETPEPANRRADYVLAAEEPPARGARAEWKSIP